ncbi:MAG: hypothetical protein JWL76_292 [Thermoleophilia bacterium]|nr:hypothetical protein [Thermoleophilia bacterium]
MDDDPPSPDSSDAATPDPRVVEPERVDAKAKAENLVEHAAAATDATWADKEVGRHVVPGIVSGDLGPKGRVAAQLRDLSRREKSSYGEVPRGTTHGQGGFRYLLLPMLGLAVVLVLIAVAIGWLAS